MDAPLIPLGPDPVAGPTQDDIAAQVPEGLPVKLEIDCSTGACRYVALTPSELKQRDADEAASAADAAKRDQDDAVRDALVAKLASGKASDDEVQQALAHVLGGND